MEMQHLEYHLNTQYRLKYSQMLSAEIARRREERAARIAEHKRQHAIAMQKSREELTKLFPPEEKKKVVVFKHGIEIWLTCATEELGLVWYEMVNPGFHSLTAGTMYTWYIIGRKKKYCERKMEELKKEGRWEIESSRMLHAEEEASRKAREEAELERKAEAVAEALEELASVDL